MAWEDGGEGFLVVHGVLNPAVFGTFFFYPLFIQCYSFRKELGVVRKSMGFRFFKDNNRIPVCLHCNWMEDNSLKCVGKGVSGDGGSNPEKDNYLNASLTGRPTIASNLMN